MVKESVERSPTYHGGGVRWLATSLLDRSRTAWPIFPTALHPTASATSPPPTILPTIQSSWPAFAVAKAGVLPRDAAMLPIASQSRNLLAISGARYPLQHSLSGGCSAEMVSLTVSAPNAAFH